MNVFLWIAQAILAAMFAMSGLEKLVRPKDKLAGKYPWTQTFSQTAVRSIGVMELLGTIGLIVPAATGIAPVLTPIAATGLAIMMILAGALHIRRKEPSGLMTTAVLLVLCALVAWGRFGPYGW
ncbi:DoxX family protein [Nonomuraea angiospora]|uniref:DoxX family protein n=1 Tax=Nonomuraea angiospora TaxID=46172 RepID=UPI0029B9794C|nr:DoxX family protein [Nonomuraea angiospora]MDX3100346.1 DoxX family protein [Nonomuraea angiospora]